LFKRVAGDETCRTCLRVNSEIPARERSGGEAVAATGDVAAASDLLKERSGWPCSRLGAGVCTLSPWVVCECLTPSRPHAC